MPIYEYGCPECDYQFELMRPFSQASEGASCPECSQGAERKLSVFAAFTRNASGMSAPVGAGSCSGCAATDCDTCDI